MSNLFVFFYWAEEEKKKKEEKKSQRRLCLIPHPSPCSCTKEKKLLSTWMNIFFQASVLSYTVCFYIKTRVWEKNNEKQTRKKSPFPPLWPHFRTTVDSLERWRCRLFFSHFSLCTYPHCPLPTPHPPIPPPPSPLWLFNRAVCVAVSGRSVTASYLYEFVSLKLTFDALFLFWISFEVHNHPHPPAHHHHHHQQLFLLFG